MDIPPIIETKMSAIRILTTVELNFVARVFEVLIVAFHSWSDSLSQNPEIFPSSIRRICLIGADGGQIRGG